MGVDYTNGWDALVATSQKNVNSAMQLAYNDGLLPKTASASFTIPLFGIDIPVSVDAQLGAWQLAGGSGKNVIVSIPFTGGTMTIGTDQPPIDLQGVVLQVTCLLSYIKSPVQPEQGTDYTLQIDFVSPDAIVAVNVLNAPLDLSSIEIVLLNFLKNAFGGHTYDIVTVSLASVSETYPYLIPTLFEYAVDTNSTDPDSTIFGVQMLTVNSQPGNQDIVPGTVPTGSPTCDSAILLSNQLFAQKLLMPGFVSALNVDPSNLTTNYEAGTWSIINNGNITLDTDHDPTITSLNANIDNNLLSLTIIGNVEATPGITIDFTITASYELDLDTNAGVQTLNLVQQSQTVDHTVDVATWVIIVTAALAILVAAVFTPLAAFIVAIIEALIIFIIATVANNTAGTLLTSSLPAMLSANVSWTNLQDFTIQQALMPTPLQLGGTIPALQLGDTIQDLDQSRGTSPGLPPAERPKQRNGSGTAASNYAPADSSPRENPAMANYEMPVIIRFSKEELAASLGRPATDADVERLGGLNVVLHPIGREPQVVKHPSIDNVNDASTTLAALAETLKPMEEQLFQQLRSNPRLAKRFVDDPLGTVEALGLLDEPTKAIVQGHAQKLTGLFRAEK